MCMLNRTIKHAHESVSKYNIDITVGKMDYLSQE